MANILQVIEGQKITVFMFLGSNHRLKMVYIYDDTDI